MGSIFSFSCPIMKTNGSYSISVSENTIFKERRRFGVVATIDMDFTNDVTFEFLHFQISFVGIVTSLGISYRTAYNSSLFNKRRYNNNKLIPSLPICTVLTNDLMEKAHPQWVIVLQLLKNQIHL